MDALVYVGFNKSLNKKDIYIALLGPHQNLPKEWISSSSVKGVMPNLIGIPDVSEKFWNEIGRPEEVHVARIKSLGLKISQDSNMCMIENVYLFPLFYNTLSISELTLSNNSVSTEAECILDIMKIVASDPFLNMDFWTSISFIYSNRTFTFIQEL